MRRGRVASSGLAMHERSVVDALIRQATDIVYHSGSDRAITIGLRVGALSHMSVPHLRGHFAAAADGTVLEEAALDIVVDDDATADGAMDVVLTHVEVADPE